MMLTDHGAERATTLTAAAHAWLRALARRLPARHSTIWQGQLLALACTAGGAGLRFLFDPLVHGHVPVVIFYPFVLVASIWGGGVAGLTVMAQGA